MRRKNIAITAAATLGGAVLLVSGTAYSISALNVEVPLFPAIGQATAAACDTDGGLGCPRRTGYTNRQIEFGTGNSLANASALPDSLKFL